MKYNQNLSNLLFQFKHKDIEMYTQTWHSLFLHVLQSIHNCTLQIMTQDRICLHCSTMLNFSHALDTRKMNIECHLMEEQILGLQARLEAENHAKSKTGGHVEKLVERAHFLEQELERRQGLP